MTTLMISAAVPVMDLTPKSGLTVKEDVMTRYDLYTADEVFLTGTAVEIVSAVKIDNRVIGDGKPGKTTKALTQAFKKITTKEGVKYVL